MDLVAGRFLDKKFKKAEECGQLLWSEWSCANGDLWMILTTHAVVGAALATFLPSHPAAAFAIGFASHFVLDAIPHLDYPIKSRSVDPKIGAPMVFDRALLQDVITIGSDGLFGMLVSLLLFSSSANFWAVLMGAVGAILPDPLQFAYTRFPSMGSLEKENWERFSWGQHTGGFCRLGRWTNGRHSSWHL
jgi:hypothetical protein